MAYIKGATMSPGMWFEHTFEGRLKVAKVKAQNAETSGPSATPSPSKGIGAAS